MSDKSTVSTISADGSLLASSLSVLAGLITNFIATIILVIFRSSSRQNAEYFSSVSESLERQVALDILDEIKKNNTAETTLTVQLEVIRLIFEGEASHKEKTKQ
jgi:hypothetical protein